MTKQIHFLLALSALAHAGLAQTWEVGGAGGGGFSRQIAVSNASERASAGFAHSAAFGGFLAQNLYRSLSGEIRYTFRPSGLQVSSGGSKATFQGQSHALHYDVLIYTKPADSPVRPFLAAGAGVKVFRGTGRESAYQPLQELALLTKTEQWKPLISIGGGAKWVLSPRLFLRVEFRDYVTPFPERVIAPSSGSKLGGWLHDIVPLAGVSYVF
jgi:hypothetical protein